MHNTAQKGIWAPGTAISHKGPYPSATKLERLAIAIVYKCAESALG